MTNSSFNNITIFNKTIKNNNFINKNYNKNKIKMWTGNTPPVDMYGVMEIMEHLIQK